MATIRASYTITPEDIGAWMRFWRENDPRRRRFSQLIRALGYLAAICLAFRTAQHQSNATSSAIAFVFVAVLLVGILSASRLGRRDWSRLARRYVPEEESAFVYGDHELELDEGGIKTQNSLGKSEFSWKAISRIGETDAHLFLYLAPNQAIVIPASSLSGSSLGEIAERARSSAIAAA